MALTSNQPHPSPTRPSSVPGSSTHAGPTRSDTRRHVAHDGAPAVHVVAADHPSLDGDIDAFLDRVRREQRYFGPTARRNPKPVQSLTSALRERSGFRMAAVECGRIVALARVDEGGELFLVVGPEHRGRGIGTALGRAVALRACDLGVSRVVLRTSRRSHAARRVGEELGAVVVDRGRGRVEVILDLVPAHRTA